MKIKLSIILFILFTGLGCESSREYDIEKGYYIGHVDSIHFRCNYWGENTTIIQVNSDFFQVKGKVDIIGKQHALVWIHPAVGYLTLQARNRITAEHYIVDWWVKR